MVLETGLGRDHRGYKRYKAPWGDTALKQAPRRMRATRRQKENFAVGGALVAGKGPDWQNRRCPGCRLPEIREISMFIAINFMFLTGAVLLILVIAAIASSASAPSGSN